MMFPTQEAKAEDALSGTGEDLAQAGQTALLKRQSVFMQSF